MLWGVTLGLGCNWKDGSETPVTEITILSFSCFPNIASNQPGSGSWCYYTDSVTLGVLLFTRIEAVKQNSAEQCGLKYTLQGLDNVIVLTLGTHWLRSARKCHDRLRKAQSC